MDGRTVGAGWGYELVENMDKDAEEGDVDHRHEGEGPRQESDDRLRARGEQHLSRVLRIARATRRGKASQQFWRDIWGLPQSPFGGSGNPPRAGLRTGNNASASTFFFFHLAQTMQAYYLA